MRLVELLVILLLILPGAHGCAGKAPDPRDASRDAIKAQEEPHGADPCLWVLALSDRDLADQVLARIHGGTPFRDAAMHAVTAWPGRAATNSDCFDLARLDPSDRDRLKELNPDQVSQPFRLDEGWGLAWRTSERWRVKGKRLLRQQLYNAAEKAFMEDLTRHPASATSWRLLARCRLARGDYAAGVEYLRRARRWAPGDDSITLELAQAQEILAEKERTAQAYRQPSPEPQPEPTRAAAEPTAQPEGYLDLPPKPAPVDAKAAKPAKPAKPAAPPARVVGRVPLAALPTTTSDLMEALLTNRPAPGWYLQAATLTSPEGATKACVRWRNQGQECHLESWRDPKGRVWLRLMLGPFQSSDAAKDAGRRYQAQGLIPPGWLTRRRP